MLVEGFPEGGSYRDGAGVWAGVEGGEVIFGCCPGIRGIEKRRRDLKVRVNCHAFFVEVMKLTVVERWGRELEIKLRGVVTGPRT